MVGKSKTYIGSRFLKKYAVVDWSVLIRNFRKKKCVKLVLADLLKKIK